ncbi:MAG: DUF1311 domain-containing protein [Alphaproteobacteria bacterium]|nr:DUF1311 domain-containing protein [Alphaproteobacteria bacterium]
MKAIVLAAAVAACVVAAGAAGLDPVLNDPILSWQDDPSVKDCKNAETTLAMNVCAGRAYKKSYTTMVALYNQLYAKYDAPNKKLLQASQRAWRGYVDAECAYENNLTAGGTIHSTMLTNCNAGLVDARIKQLKAQANCEEGDMSCNHP